MQTKNIYEDVKNYALDLVEKNPQFASFPDHFYYVETAAMKFCEYYPEADREVIRLTVWLHDVGHFVIEYKAEYHADADHAVFSEEMGRKFLEKHGVEPEKIEKILHCVRAHRNRDVKPDSIEAKIIAAADSASHLIGDGVFTFVLRRYGREAALGKLERDYRDMNIIPEATKELHDLYENWKNLLNNYPDWDWPEELIKK